MVKRERSVSPGRTRGGDKKLREALGASAREAEQRKEEDADEEAEIQEANEESAREAKRRKKENADEEAEIQEAIKRSNEMPSEKPSQKRKSKKQQDPLTAVLKQSQLEADQKNLIRTDLQRKLRENICLLRNIRGGGWTLVTIARDGNCLFEALAHDLRVHWTQLNCQDRHKLLDGVKKKISDWQQQDQLLAQLRQDLDSFFNDTKFDQLKLRQLLVTFMKGNP